MQTTSATLALLAAASLATAGGISQNERNVQIRSVDLQASVIEVHNFGDAAQALDGWRFCTHSAAAARRYTGASSLNGVSIEPGESVFLYVNDDAPKAAGNLNYGDLGAIAGGFGQGPFTVQLFWPNGGSLSFGSTDDMVDHIQWSVGGVNNPVAGTRSAQAVNAGIWTVANAWIVTSGNSESIDLIPSGGELHGPASYLVTEPALNCNAADIAAPFGVLDLADIGAFVSAFTTGGADADLAPPMGVFDLADIGTFVSAFTAGCP